MYKHTMFMIVCPRGHRRAADQADHVVITIVMIILILLLLLLLPLISILLIIRLIILIMLIIIIILPACCRSGRMSMNIEPLTRFVYTMYVVVCVYYVYNM